MNKQIQRLRRAEERARRINNMMDRNRQEFDRAYAKAIATPEWAAYCADQGIVERYNYGDVIC